MKVSEKHVGQVAQGIVLGLLLLAAIAVMMAEGAAAAVFRYQGF